MAGLVAHLFQQRLDFLLAARRNAPFEVAQQAIRLDHSLFAGKSDGPEDDHIQTVYARRVTIYGIYGNKIG